MQRLDEAAEQLLFRKGWPGGSDELISLDEFMDRLHIAGLSAALLSDSEVVECRHWGVARDSSPVSDDTIFLAGSVSKAIAGLVALCLVRDGALTLDAPVNGLLKRWQVPPFEGSVPDVSLRQLLSHTAGFGVHGFFGYRRDQPVPALEQILSGTQPSNNDPVALVGLPGTAMQYSGGGFCVVQLLVEDITGDTFADASRRLVLEPLGMARSTFANPLPEAQWDKAASGHHSSGAALWGEWFVYPEMAAAGLWTTAAELALPVADIQRILRGEAGLLPADLVHELVTPQIGGRGLGFGLETVTGQPAFAHAGSDIGFQARAVGAISGAFGMTVVTNSDLGLSAAAALEQSVSRVCGWESSA